MHPLKRRRPLSRLHAALLAAAFGVVEVSAQNTTLDSAALAPPNLDSLSASAQVQPVLIYFPPVPPALDTRIPVSSRTGPFTGAPPDLDVYAGEIFYPQLATRMAQRTDPGSLPASLRRRVEDYRGTVALLVEQLRGELLRVQGEAPAARLRALEALARGQASGLAALEEKAEELRRDLGSVDWDDLRVWRLTEPDTRGFTPKETAAVVLNAAFYWPNLTLVQRGLLREVAFELAQAGRDSSEDAAQFFSPEMARVRLPAELSPAATVSLTSYENLKARLKKELFDTIRAQDKSGLNLLRGRELRALAERQAPDLAALEIAAESFRRELPARAWREPTRSSLPEALVQRVEAWTEALNALRAESIAQVDALNARYRSKLHLFPIFSDRELEIEIQPPRGEGPGPRGGTGRGPLPISEFEERAAVADATDEIADEYERRIAPLIAEKAVIYADIGRAIDRTQPAAIHAAFDQVARLKSLALQAPAWEEYRTAVFEPGLSPAQRRLLFSAALAELKLSLPSGEMQPRGRSDPARSRK